MNYTILGNYMTMEELSQIIEYYDIKAYLSSDTSKVSQGKISEPCRYCGKSRNEVKFKQVCHSIPEALGNKNFISEDECDECNQKYSAIEQALVLFLMPYKMAYRLVGKTKKSNTRKYKGINDDFVLVDRSLGTIRAGHLKPDGSIEITIQEKQTPQDIYRALCKIALNFVERDDLAGCLKNTLRWIDKDSYFPDKTLPLVAECVVNLGNSAAFSAPDHPGMIIMKRKPTSPSTMPLFIAWLILNGASYMYVLPTFEKDEPDLTSVKEIFPILRSPSTEMRDFSLDERVSFLFRGRLLSEISENDKKELVTRFIEKCKEAIKTGDFSKMGEAVLFDYEPVIFVER